MYYVLRVLKFFLVELPIIMLPGFFFVAPVLFMALPEPLAEVGVKVAAGIACASPLAAFVFHPLFESLG